METTVVLHAQISCPCTPQVSTSFFPPCLLLSWVYYLYPAPYSQDLSSMTPQILCLKSLLFNFSMHPSPVLLLRSGTVRVPQFLSPCKWIKQFPPPPFHGIARHTLPPKIQLRKSLILPLALTVEATPWKNNWGESPLSPSATSWRLSSFPGRGAVAQLLTVLGCSARLVLRASSSECNGQALNKFSPKSTRPEHCDKILERNSGRFSEDQQKAHPHHKMIPRKISFPCSKTWCHKNLSLKESVS